MKALTNLRNTIPAFFKEFVDTRAQGIEIVQIIERKSHFTVLSFDKFDRDYTVSQIAKGWVNDESNAFVDNETYSEADFQEFMCYRDEDDTDEIETFEDYANYLFECALRFKSI